MITRIKNTAFIPLLTLIVVTIFLVSCQKENSQSSSSQPNGSRTIAVSASASQTGPGGSDDTVYIMQTCPPGYSRDSIGENDLPSVILTYLSANYSGFTFNKAFAIINNSGQTSAYVAIIYFDDKPVGILFDSTGNFVKVLEQREKGDLDGKGWHDGGRFCDRNGLEKDTVSLSALPPSIITYMTANFATDTLVKAFQGRHDNSYVVISKNNGLFATIFDAAGNFVKRVSLPVPPGICISLTQTALPANVLSYLTATYPNYAFEKAFAVYSNNVLQGYAVLIDENNTKYAILFDGSGNFVSARTIW